MREETVPVPVEGADPLPCFVVKTDDFPNPSVVVVQEWWGLNDQIRGVARRLAEERYTAIVPDLFRGTVTEQPTEARRLSMELDRPRAVKDLQAAIGWLLGQGAPTVGAMGFCMGGGLVWMLAHEDPRLNAAVPFYGKPNVEGKELLCPILAHFGGADRSTPPAMIEDLRHHLKHQPYASEVFVYDGAPHAFFNEEYPAYRPDAAELAWQRTIQFFRNELGEN